MSKSAKRRLSPEVDATQIADLMIDYPSSPNGRAYIGIAKKPLMPNDNGIGFKGVLVQDEKREYVQCSGCGKWQMRIDNNHTQKCLGITTQEYKEKFGLYTGEGLVSDVTSYKLAQNVIKAQAHKLSPLFNTTTAAKASRKTVRRKQIGTMQHENAHGTCPEQLKSRLREFILSNKELPSSANRGSSLAKSLMRRFGTLSAAFEHYGLPFRKRIGTTLFFRFSDNSLYQYNINQLYDRDMLYNMMLQKCPILTHTT